MIPYYDDYTTAWYKIRDFVPKIKPPSYKELNIGHDETAEIGVRHGRETVKEGYTAKKVNADGSHDTNDTSEYWGRSKAKIAIPIRKNAKIRLTGASIVNEKYASGENGLQKAAKATPILGQTCSRSENSGTKREYGENLRPKNDENKCAEAIQRFWAYGLLKDYG